MTKYIKNTTNPNLFYCFFFLSIDFSFYEYAKVTTAPLSFYFFFLTIFYFVLAAVSLLFIQGRTELVGFSIKKKVRLPYKAWLAVFAGVLFPCILILSIFFLFLLNSSCFFDLSVILAQDSTYFFFGLFNSFFKLIPYVYFDPIPIFHRPTFATHFNWLWFNFGNGAVMITFRLGIMQLFMFWVVLSITMFVIFFSFEYMTTDPRKRVFIAHILFFSVFMAVFLMSDDLITAFIGWEGVGLSSFFLINFWFTRIQANKSAFKAVLVNKVGDLAFLIAIAASYSSWKTVSFSLLWDVGLVFLVPATVKIFGYTFLSTDIILLCLIIAASAKSAQIGLHTWLPDAMEGPTPVSALIHAATMVTAGILLLIKVFPLLVLSVTLSWLIVLIGATTSLLAGTIACTQHDIKKIIAYSTCSQLGLMFMACGLGYPYFAFFHLVTHAFFKALLFLSAGSVVHFVSDEQDIRKMGGLSSLMPYTNVSFFFGNLCIIGFPFYSGFYSKEILFFESQQFSWFIYVICVLSTALTSFYSCRLHWYVMWRPAPHTAMVDSSISCFSDLKKFFYFLFSVSSLSARLRFLEHGKRVRFVLLFLTFLSISAGYVFHDFLVFLAYLDFSSPITNLSSLYFENELSVLSKLFPLFLVFFISFFFLIYQLIYVRLLHDALLKTTFMFRGWSLIYDKISFISFLPFMVKLKYCFLTSVISLNTFLRLVYDACSLAWHFNTFINYFISKIIFFSYQIYYFFDRLVLDKVAGANLLFVINYLSRFFSFLVVKSNITIYFFYIFLFFTFLFFFLF